MDSPHYGHEQPTHLRPGNRCLMGTCPYYGSKCPKSHSVRTPKYIYGNPMHAYCLNVKVYNVHVIICASAMCLGIGTEE